MADSTFTLGVELSTSKAVQGLKNLQRELQNTEKNASNIGRNSTRGVDGLTRSVGGLTRAFSGLGAVIGGLAIGTIVNDAVRTISAFEGLNTTLTTITGSATAAAQAIQLIQGVSANTAFSVQQLGEAYVKLSAAGIQPTTELLTLFSDVASVTTDKLGALQSITDLYARTTAGGLGLEELNRLADRGIPVFDILGKRLGVSRLQISELGKSAEGAQIILRQLEEGLRDSFGGASATQLNTLNGQFSQLRKNIENLFTGVGDAGATQGLKDLLSVFNETIKASDGTAKSLGAVLGDALRTVAELIRSIKDNFEEFKFVVLGAAAAVTILATGGLGGIVAGLGRIAFVLRSGGIESLLNFIVLRFSKLVEVASTRLIPVIDSLSKSWLFRAGAFATALLGLELLRKGINKVAEALGLIDKKPTITITAEEEKSFKADIDNENKRFLARAEANKKQNEDLKRAQELLTGRDQIISKIVAGLRQETSLIGLSNQQVETQNKIYEAQAQIRDKLLNAGKTEAEANREATRLVNERAGEIRAAVAAKYTAELNNQLKIMREQSDFEISLIGLSQNQIDIQTRLRERLVELGIKDTATQEQKKKILEDITRLQEAQINNTLRDSLRGITEETAALKLNNTEREKRAQLDEIARNAGFSGRADLLLNRPADYFRISSALDARNQEAINQAATKEIDSLKEQSYLLSIIDEKERQRVQNRLAIYRAIDPDGKGKNITDAQKAEIELLNRQIEAQNELIRVNEQINDSFRSLGDAVTQWALGTDGAIKRVRLELIKLAALEIWKQAFGGAASGIGGAFFSGLIGGLGGGRAMGGPIQAGKVYRVGEQGPETIVSSTNGMVVPQNRMIANTSSPITVTLNPVFNNNGTINSAEDIDAMFQEWGTGIVEGVTKTIRQQYSAAGLSRA